MKQLIELDRYNIKDLYWVIERPGGRFKPEFQGVIFKTSGYNTAKVVWRGDVLPTKDEAYEQTAAELRRLTGAKADGNPE